jgi:type II secretory pathway pseudopilin PulG
MFKPSNLIANKNLHEKQRGDTIVEVLISIAVISLVMGGAYVTTNRNLLATRAAQERGNALTLVESQLEQIKSLAITDADALFDTNAPAEFCISQDQSIVGAGTADCRVDQSGAPTEAEPVYDLSVTRSGPDANLGYIFEVTNTWVDPSGDHNNEVKMIYRIYR